MIGATQVLVGQDLIIAISHRKFQDFVEKCVDYAVSLFKGVWGWGGWVCVQGEGCVGV